MSYIFINSKDRIQGTPNDFVVQLDATFHKQSYSPIVSQVIIKNMEYPVNTKNNKVYFYENKIDTLLIATIPVGNYSITEFITILKAQLELVGANTYTITYNSNLSFITISAGSDTIKLGNGSINRILGMVNTTTFTTSLTSIYPINLAGTDYVDVFTNFDNNNYKSGKVPFGRPVIRIPINVQFGSLIVWENRFDNNVKSITSSREIRITLIDDNDEYLTLPDNAEVSIKFFIS
jgi:hypothetical protein